MSGEPKTLTPQAMTLKEAAERVAEKSDYLLARGEDGWGLIKRTVLGWDSEGLVWDEWEDAASFALGVRVVARDEAAELRAALDAARDAMVSALAYHHHSLSNPVKEELNAAINRAGRALAGGESDQ